MSAPVPPAGDAAASLSALAEEFERQAAAVSDEASFEQLRVAWVGRRQGRLRALMTDLRNLPPERRREFGQAVNNLQRHVEDRLAALEAQRAAAAASRRQEAERLDVTLPGRDPLLGGLHPVTLVLRDVEEVFRGLGYSVAEGPEIEDDFHNFEALNFPPGHPARDEQDTLFVADGRLLRTHTSPVQIRTLLARRPPVRVICPGRVFRNDNDLRHSPMFHQVEGLHVDEGISLAHLKGTLEAMVRALFHPDTGVRLRPSYFPFTEPSCEVDITCPFCRGGGCATCSRSGWLEILGAGMVDPRVLANCGVDPDRYSGFAFGMGLDRVAMIRHGIPNIRILFEGDQRVLEQARD